MNWARHLYKEEQDSGVTTSTDLHDWQGENDYHFSQILQFVMRTFPVGKS
jgi:hypothetical protein